MIQKRKLKKRFHIYNSKKKSNTRRNKLTKEAENLYAENYKMWLKEVKEHEYTGRQSVHGLGGLTVGYQLYQRELQIR